MLSASQPTAGLAALALLPLLQTAENFIQLAQAPPGKGYKASRWAAPPGLWAVSTALPGSSWEWCAAAGPSGVPPLVASEGLSARPCWFTPSHPRRFHRIIPTFMCQGGDFTADNGAQGLPASLPHLPSCRRAS